MRYIKPFKTFESVINEKLYHGNRKGDFPPEKRRFAGAIFLTSNLEFAKNFAGFDEREEFPNGGVWEVSLKSNLKLCYPMSQDTINKLDLISTLQKMIASNYVDPTNGTKFLTVQVGLSGYNPENNENFELKTPDESVYHYLWRIKNGAWRIIECQPIIEQIKSNGYDGFYVIERGSKNVAIFNENSIKKFEKIL